MKHSSLLRIFLARKFIILTAFVSCLAGGLFVLVTSPPRYEATARITLDYVKPDRLTGAVVNSKMIDAYITTQIELVRDVQVTSVAADNLGWTDNPDFIDAFNAEHPEGGDYRAWVGARLAAGLSANMVEDSNIMAIKYRANTPQDAMTVADAVRTAYIAAMVGNRQEGARASADALTAAAVLLQGDVVKLGQKRLALEKATGVVLEGGHRDLDAARMEHLARQLPPTSIPGYSTKASIAAQQLAALDSQIDKAAGSLGPNNPRLQAMQRQRDFLAAQVAREQKATYIDPVALDTQVRVAQLDIQKTKVLSQREKVLTLRLVQDEIDAKAAEVKDINLRVAQLREMSSLDATSASAFGAATFKPKPVFPDPMLILGGTGVLGLALGGLMAIFIELMGRTVRSERDLAGVISAPLLGVVPEWRPGAGRRGAKAPRTPGRRALAAARA